MERNYSIYRLFDKRAPDVTRYVGMTKDVELRFSQHLLCDGANPDKDAWIRTSGVEIGKEVIETKLTLSEARKREAHWIDLFIRKGMPLLNKSIPSLCPGASHKNHEKYLYVEIALPKDNPAVQNLVVHSEKTAIPLRVLIRSAAILAYSDEEDTDVMPAAPKPTTKKSGRKNVAKDPVITDASRESANSLLDDMGF